MNVSKSEYIIELSRDLIDDIELSRLGAQALLLKTSRLARYADDEEIREWLRFEMQSFDHSAISLKYMTKTGRWTDREKEEGYWWPLAKIEATLT